MDPKTGKPNAGFISQREKFLAVAKEGETQVVFLGDSITAGWAGAGKEVWAKSFGQWTPANFGIGGDRTQHVLWRIENGELEGIKPKAAVIMIGTNNTGGDSAEDIAKGVTKIVETVRQKLPSTKILLLAVFPRGSKPDGKLANPGYEKIKQVNKIIAKLDERERRVSSISATNSPRGKTRWPRRSCPDFLHLSPVTRLGQRHHAEAQRIDEVSDITIETMAMAVCRLLSAHFVLLAGGLGSIVIDDSCNLVCGRSGCASRPRRLRLDVIVEGRGQRLLEEELTRAGAEEAR